MKNKTNLIVLVFVLVLLVIILGVFCILKLLDDRREDSKSPSILTESNDIPGYSDPRGSSGGDAGNETPVDSQEPSGGEESKNQEEEQPVDELLLMKEQVEKLTTQVAFLDSEIQRLLHDQISYNNDNNYKLFKITFMLIATVSIILIVIILSVFELVFLVKVKKNNRDLNEKLENTTKEFESYRSDINRELKNLTPRRGGILDIKPAVFDNTEQLKKLENRLNILEDSFKKQKTEEEKIEKEKEEIARGIDPLKLYNNWAANPIFPLPQTFCYVKGEMRIRTTQQIVESISETRWITNRHGDKKYLFPNPRSFDQIQMTDISELYRMEMDMLKPRGQNKIKIIEPCEMSNAGFINYPGELTIL